MKIPFARIYFTDEDTRETLSAIDQALTSGQLTLGKWGKEFEDKFSAYVGTKYAVAVNSGTVALEIILGVPKIEGHSVIVPTNIFFATLASVLHARG
ncbi:DegT/DnrJ/EryC1/StrS family aminotransferase [Chloroflexota bacterium]